MMRRMRFSIAGLMGFVLVAALSFGGLKGANEAWASGSYTLIIATLILAVLTAVQSRGRNRAYWAGFAIAGCVYFGAVFGAMGPFRVTPPQLLTELLFDRLEAMMHPTNTVTFTVTLATPPPVLSFPSAPGSPTNSSTLSGVMVATTTNPAPVALAPPAPAVFAYTYPPAPPLTAMPTSTMSRVHFSQVAHSLMVLLVGMLGGFYSAWLWARRERREVSPTAKVSPSSP